jgi:hypothetical protein
VEDCILKKISICLLIFISALIFFGCQSSPADLGVYDLSVPAEQNCILSIPYSIVVDEYDGQEVDWYNRVYKKLKAGSDFYIIRIPAGIHIFDFRARFAGIVGIWTITNRAWEFEAGKEYQFIEDPGIYTYQADIDLYEIEPWKKIDQLDYRKIQLDENLGE